MVDQSKTNLPSANLRLVTALDKLKKVSARGTPYWYARTLMPLLGYESWENFEGVIEKARQSFVSTGVDPRHHIHETTKMVALGKGATRKVREFALTRDACYLIAMNGDPAKPEIAAAQGYFAAKTREQEQAQEEEEASRRLSIRDRIKDENKSLASAAKKAGVANYPLFQDAGYRGLYGELRLAEIKKKKGLDEKEDLLNRAGREELAANEFRITQTDRKLRDEKIQGEMPARETHHRVGKIVREAIRKAGNPMPEELSGEPSLKKLARKRRTKQLPPPKDPTP